MRQRAPQGPQLPRPPLPGPPSSCFLGPLTWDPDLPRFFNPRKPTPCLPRTGIPFPKRPETPPLPGPYPLGTFALSGRLSPRVPGTPALSGFPALGAPSHISLASPPLQGLDLWGRLPCTAPKPPTSLCSGIKGDPNPSQESLVANPHWPSDHFDQSRDTCFLTRRGSLRRALGPRHSPTQGPPAVRSRRIWGRGPSTGCAEEAGAGGLPLGNGSRTSLSRWVVRPSPACCGGFPTIWHPRERCSRDTPRLPSCVYVGPNRRVQGSTPTRQPAGPRVQAPSGTWGFTGHFISWGPPGYYHGLLMPGSVSRGCWARRTGRAHLC